LEQIKLFANEIHENSKHQKNKSLAQTGLMPTVFFIATESLKWMMSVTYQVAPGRAQINPNDQIQNSKLAQ
jgi:hypothetical protein